MLKETNPKIMSQAERDDILTFIAVREYKIEKLLKIVVPLCIFNCVIAIVQTLLLILSLKQ